MGSRGREGVFGWMGRGGSGWVGGRREERGREEGKEEVKAYVTEMSAEQYNTL